MTITSFIQSNIIYRSRAVMGQKMVELGAKAKDKEEGAEVLVSWGSISSSSASVTGVFGGDLGEEGAGVEVKIGVLVVLLVVVEEGGPLHLILKNLISGRIGGAIAGVNAIDERSG